MPDQDKGFPDAQHTPMAPSDCDSPATSAGSTAPRENGERSNIPFEPESIHAFNAGLGTPKSASEKGDDSNVEEADGPCAQTSVCDKKDTTSARPRHTPPSGSEPQVRTGRMLAGAGQGLSSLAFSLLVQFPGLLARLHLLVSQHGA